MRIHARALAAAGIPLLILGIAACGGGDDGDGETNSTEPTEATDEATDDTAAESTTTTLSPEAEVLAAYDRAQLAVKAAFDPANPQHPDLLATHAGAQLERFQEDLAEYELEGVSEVLLDKESNPTVVTLGDTAALVEDCMTEVLQVVDTATRQPRAAERSYTVLLNVDLERIDGAWKIVSSRIVEETC
jgi:hypothetical protein